MMTAIPAAASTPITPSAVVADSANLAGKQVTVSGTYIHSQRSVFDDESIVSMGVPGPVAGAKALAVESLPEDLVSRLATDELFGSGERWGHVELSGTVDVKAGVASLKVASGQIVEDAPYGADDEISGLID